MADHRESPAESSVLATLNARSREIFRNIVDSYLNTGEPVGSRHLSRMLPMSLSPASVRNVMQDLEELGLIYAPHASAGRLPTQQGLRRLKDEGLLDLAMERLVLDPRFVGLFTERERAIAAERMRLMWRD